MEDLISKEESSTSDLKDSFKKIDAKEVDTLRHEQNIKAILKQARKSESKLDKVKIRIKNLEGDCLIFACSVAFLGALSVEERMHFRKIMAEKLLSHGNIESSEYWQNT